MEVLQGICNSIILICYVVLFVLFLILIKRDPETLGPLNSQVIAFFTVMIALLTANFVLDIIFYLNFNSEDYAPKNDPTRASQDTLVSVTTYIHSILEVLFNLVLLWFLISQATADA